MIDEKMPPKEIVKSLYRKTLSRDPNEAEVSKLNHNLANAREPKEKLVVLEDIFWALLNSKEYLFNH